VEDDWWFDSAVQLLYPYAILIELEGYWFARFWATSMRNCAQFSKQLGLPSLLFLLQTGNVRYSKNK